MIADEKPYRDSPDDSPDDAMLDQLLAAVSQLDRSERGRNAMRALLTWLDADGLALDAKNQEAVLTILASVWGRFPGFARDFMRERLSHED